MKRGKNKDFIINAVIMILQKNYNISIKDTHEIDSSISIGENIHILLNKYTLNQNLTDIS